MPAETVADLRARTHAIDLTYKPYLILSTATYLTSRNEPYDIVYSTDSGLFFYKNHELLMRRFAQAVYNRHMDHGDVELGKTGRIPLYDYRQIPHWHKAMVHVTATDKKWDVHKISWLIETEMGKSLLKGNWEKAIEVSSVDYADLAHCIKMGIYLTLRQTKVRPFVMLEQCCMTN